MLTRRLPRLPALFHTFSLLGFTAALGLASACVTIETGDGGGDDNSDETGNSSGNNNNDSGNNDGNNNDGNDDSSDLCADACDVLASCGFPVGECLEFCVSGPCAACLADSDQCGQDCANACTAPGDGDGDPTGDGDGDDDPTAGDGDGDQVPPKECVINNDCGLSFECVSCNLNDSEGWCEQSMDCSFDEDCGFGGKCGYNVQTADWRCLPAAYCK